MRRLTRSDCGEGTQRQLILPHVQAGVKLSNIRTILITHLHPDRTCVCADSRYSRLDTADF